MAKEPELTTEKIEDGLNETKQTDFGLVKKVSIVEEVQKAYVDYAMSVIVSRALPDVRDGLKPVHRRILYAMHEAGITHSSPYKKSARIVGDVLGKFHPHGDTAVYDALVRLAQDFSMRYPLIDGQGNFGSVDGDPAAQMRYTEARMENISQELLKDIDKETVKFTDNFDASLQEPDVLPALLPNLLLMGADGIAVGMATKIPPHNLVEVVGAINELIDQGESPITDEEKEKLENPETDDPQLLIGNFESPAGLDDLLKHIKGPDFPTGGQIYNQEDIRQVYATGKGQITIRAITGIKEISHGKAEIKVTQLPYQVNKAKLISKIADLVKKDKLDGISDIIDESDRQGLSISIELKRNAIPKKVLNNLFKQSKLQTSFPANMVALSSDLHPHIMNLKQILNEYVIHRQLVIVKRSQHDLKSARARAHILEGLLKALDHIDEIIELIKKSDSSNDAQDNLMKKYQFSEKQAQAILSMQLRRLAALERQKVKDEYDELMSQIEDLLSIITNPKKILKVIQKELKEVVKKYGDDRKTKVHLNPIGEFQQEDLIPSEDCIVTLTKTGYIKRMSTGTFRSQRRGGKGVSGMTKREADELNIILSANTHDHLLIFTDQGQVYQIRVWDIPEGTRKAKGQAIINLIEITPEEKVQTIMAVPKTLDKIGEDYFLFATKQGMVKRTQIKEYENIKRNGLIAINLKKGDELIQVKKTSGKDHILLVTKKGKSIRFEEKDVRDTGRDTMGVKGINLKKGDYVLALETFNAKPPKPDDKRRKFFRHLLIVTENGLGKRTPLKQYPTQNRGGQGVKVANISKKTGEIAGAEKVSHNTEFIILSTKSAQAIKLPLKNIPELKRPTQGVILMRLKKSDKVTAVTRIDEHK